MKIHLDKSKKKEISCPQILPTKRTFFGLGKLVTLKITATTKTTTTAPTTLIFEFATSTP